MDRLNTRNILKRKKHKLEGKNYKGLIDVYIGWLALNWIPIPNQPSIENELQYQIRCLDVDEIAI